MNAFPLNAWYAAAWSHEVGARAVLGRTVCNLRMALWRRPDGTRPADGQAAAALPRGFSMARTSSVVATSAYLDAMSQRLTACEVALRS
jgi:hypothetical protein